VIAMVQALRKGIVAEGVETAEQLALLRRWDCDATQGDHLSRPVAADEFGRFVAEHVATLRRDGSPRPATALAAAKG